MSAISPIEQVCKICATTLLTGFLFFTSQLSFAQTKGIIFDPADTNVPGEGGFLLDPDQNGYVSTDANGFVSSDETESEIAYLGIPTAGTEGDGDVSHGGDCAFTDLVNTADTEPLYFYSDGTYLFFRFRLGGSSNSSKTYSVFIDSDEKYGFSGNNADPNAITGNPGFEVELALHTNGGVAIYDVDGNVDPSNNEIGDYKTDRPASRHSQKSVALTEVCGDDDYFLDFYVSFADLSAVGIDANTTMRMVAQTGISANPILGSTSGTDVGGVDDDSGNAFDLIEDLVDIFPPVSGNDLATGDPVLPRADCPTIDGPIIIQATEITGTSTEADGTTIEVFADGGSIGTTTVTSNAWTLTGFAAFSGGEVITASASITGVKSESDSDCSPITVNQICSDAPTGITKINGGSGRGLQGLSTEEGAAVSVWEDVGLTTLWAGALAPHVNPGEVGIGGSTGVAGEWRVSGNSNDLATGVYFVTVQNTGENECISEATVFCNGPGDSEVPIITTSPITIATTTIQGTSSGLTYIELIIDDVLTDQNTTSDAGGNWSFTVSDLSFGQDIMIRATETGECPVVSTVSTVTRQSIAPLITGAYCDDGSTITEVSGISSETAGTTVTLYTKISAGVTTADSQAGTGTVDASGNWTISGLSLTGGTFMAATNTNTNTDPDELESDLSNEIEILSQTTDGSLTISSLVITEGDASIAGNGTTGNTVQLYIDDVAIDGFSAVVDGSGDWTINGLDAASAGFDVLYPGGQVSVTSEAAGKCASTAVNSLDVIQCRSYTETAINLTSNATVCVNETVSVSFSSSEDLVVYQLYTDVAATNPTGSSVIGDGGDIELTSDPLANTVTKVYLGSMRIGVSCDDVFSTNFNLTVKDLPSITLDSNDFTVCDDASSASISYSNVVNGALQLYSIDFDAAAESEGFSDVSNASITAQLNFNVPGAAVAGTYNGSATVANTSSGTCVSSAYNFSFEIVEDIIAYGTASDPTCLDNDGSLQITGLKVGETYQLDYDLDGSPVTVNSITSDASGNYLIDNLEGGDYNDVSVTLSGCQSNILTATTTLTTPAVPNASITSTDITEGDASIAGTGVDGATIDLYIDDVLQSGHSATVSGGVWTISGLDAASAGSDVLYPGGQVSVRSYLAAGCAFAEVDAASVIQCKAYLENSIDLVAGSQFCVNETLDVTFAMSESGINYQLFTDAAGTQSTGLAISGDGSDITLTSAPLSTDISKIYIRAARDGVACDQIFATNFTIEVKDIPSVVLVDNTIELCAESSTFDIEYNNIQNGPLTTYSIDFDAQAEAIGFVDINDASIAATVSVDVPISAVAGSYSGQFYVSNVGGTGCQSFEDFDFDIFKDNIAYGAIVHPSCLNTDGSIEITGMLPNTTYQMDYQISGNPVTFSALTSGADGAITLSGIGSGVYSNFSVSAGGCTSNLLSEAQRLDAPAAPSVAIGTVNLTEGDASITGTGSEGSTIQLLIDNVVVSGFSTTVIGGVWTIDGLDAVTHGTDVLQPGDIVSITASLGAGCDIASVAMEDPVACKALDAVAISLVGDSEVCINETMSINIASSQTGVSYQLCTDASCTNVTGSVVNGDGLDITLTTDPLSTDHDHIYVRGTRSDVGCSFVFTTSFSIGVKGVPGITLADNDITICKTQTSVAASYTDPVNGPFLTYSFDFDSFSESQGFTDIVDASFASDLTFNIPSVVPAGEYTTVLSISSNSSGSCVSVPYTINFRIIEDNISYGNITEPTSCQGQDGSIQLLGFKPGTFYELNYDHEGEAQQLLNIRGDAAESYVLNNLEQGTYTNFSISESGCVSNVLSQPITISDPESVVIQVNTSEPPTNCLGENGFLVIDGMDADLDYILSYVANDEPIVADIVSTAEGSHTIENLPNGIYSNIMVERLACQSNIITDETVFECSEALYNTPVITPNGDGMNDYMEIENIENYPNNKVSIFNRWGNLVWEMHGYRNDESGFGGIGNSGMANGQLTDGTYFIVIDLGDNSAKQKDFVVIKR